MQKEGLLETVPELTNLINFKMMAQDLMAEVQQEDVVSPARMKTILDLGEEFGLVSRQGMATGLHFPLREKKYLGAGAPVDADLVMPTLRHVIKQTQRAINIERRGGHAPREQRPLYGFFSDKLRYR